MSVIESPIYCDIGSSIKISTINDSSSWKNTPVSFHWVNTEYPFEHSHTHWEIPLIISGSIDHNINGKTYRLSRGDTALIRPQDRHSFTNRSKSEYRHVNFLIDTRYIRGMLNAYEPELYEKLHSAADPIMITISENTVVALNATAIEIQNPANDHKSCLMRCKLIIGELLTYFLDKVYPMSGEYPDWLNTFLKNLNDPKYRNISVEQAVEMSSYSYSHLAFLFKQYMGMSIKQYLSTIKLKYAQELLSHTDMPILQISSELGFSSLSHLNHIFKNSLHMTPSEYRKNSRQPIT